MFGSIEGLPVLSDMPTKKQSEFRKLQWRWKIQLKRDFFRLLKCQGLPSRLVRYPSLISVFRMVLGLMCLPKEAKWNIGFRTFTSSSLNVPLVFHVPQWNRTSEKWVGGWVLAKATLGVGGNEWWKQSTQVCCIFSEREGCMCIQFVFGSTGQWRKDEEEVNIQRHSLTVRDTDMFSRTWQKHWKKNCWRAQEEGGLAELRNLTLCRMGWSPG